MGHDHKHARTGNETRLKWALVLTAIFLVAEAVAGFLTNSLALLSDAAHMLTDVAALAMSLIAMWIAARPPDTRRSYGYHRFEILAASINASALFVVAAYILYEAYERFRKPPEVQSGAMLIVAVLGLVVNIVSMRILSGGKEGSLNVKGAYLEVWSDMLGSIGVIAAALIIRFTGWSRVDPLIAVLIGLWVLPRTWTLLSESVNVLLEGVPEGIELREVERTLLGLRDVAEVHDLHVWSITSGRNSLTAHLRLVRDCDAEQVMRMATEAVAERFNITHTTIQTEQDAPCLSDDCGKAEARDEEHEHAEGEPNQT
jgi:cobalt-zinc-cadmium efflux system protein